MKRWILLLAGMALVVAACSSTPDSGVASLEADESPTEQQADAGVTSDEELELALLDFSACMRDNGVEDFVDPTVAADGSVEFGFGGGSAEGGPFGDVDREVVDDAFQACSEHLEAVALTPGAAGFDITEIEDTFVEFAACMRDNGVEMDDPDFSDFGLGEGGDDDGVVGGPFGELDISDPTVQAALEECQDIFGGIARFGGEQG